MLTELSIENFAIIDRLLLRFEPGFSVLTGETGAGKSIIIDALQAALGTRIPAEVVRSDARTAAVEAVFQWPDADNEALISALTEFGIEDDDCLILRREISSAGRGVARVNGRAVPLSALSAIGSLLVDIHGQSDHLSILRRDRQLDALDRYAGATELRGQVAEAVKEYTRALRALDDLARGVREAEQRLDLLRFQVQEIESADLHVGEDEDLAAERNLLVNAEKLASLAAGAYDVLQAGSASAVESVSSAASSLQDLAGIDPSLTGLSERLLSAQYEIEDVAQELRQYRDRVEYDPQRLDAIEERLDVLSRLKRKYGSTVEDVIAFGTRARAEMEDVENLDARLDELRSEVQTAERQAGELAAELSALRTRAAADMAQSVREALQSLGLKGTTFDVELRQIESPDGLAFPRSDARYAYTQSGVDNVSFLVSFNPGEAAHPLEKVASGGETSRFLLALKSVLAEADRTPTLIFDEVDVGVGGRRGMDVGERMRALSRSHQVISITHLPQIAALADQHATVVKVVDRGRTSVAVRDLAGTDRIVEIAEMMSGTGSEAARRNAEELLEAAQRRD